MHSNPRPPLVCFDGQHGFPRPSNHLDGSICELTACDVVPSLYSYLPKLTSATPARLNARYYFQKSDDSNATLNPTAPSQTSVLLYNGRGFDRQLHASSTSPANKATINEIGLPLFQPRPERHQVGGHTKSSTTYSRYSKVNDNIQLMEVKVTKERLARDG